MAKASFKVIVDTNSSLNLIQSFRTLLSRTETFPGCKGASLESEVIRPGGVRFNTEWETGAALSSFLKSDFSKKVNQLLEQGVDKPEILITWD